MSWNKSPLAFDDCKETFEQALESPRGIRVIYESRSRAINERSRFNYCRKLNRAANKDIYPEDHYMHGRSPYDTLVLRIPPKNSPDAHILYIEKRLVENLKIEQL